VDDLPGGGPEVGGYTHVQIMKDIVGVLRAHHVQYATGFVVGSMLDTPPDRHEAIDAWVEAGFEVGNHTYSHDKIGDIGLDAYMKDVLLDRPVVDALEKRTGQKHSYFRFPYFDEGDTPSERRTLANLLAAQHYVLSRASVMFTDTDWADAYLRCAERNDAEALEGLGKSYVDNAVAQLKWSVAAAHDVVGHAIPQVLVFHTNVLVAKNLDALLTAYEREGVHYIPLSETLTEPVYSGHYETGDGNVLVQASQHFGRPTPPELASPAPLIDLICR